MVETPTLSPSYRHDHPLTLCSTVLTSDSSRVEAADAVLRVRDGPASEVLCPRAQFPQENVHQRKCTCVMPGSLYLI